MVGVASMFGVMAILCLVKIIVYQMKGLPNNSLTSHPLPWHHSFEVLMEWHAASDEDDHILHLACDEVDAGNGAVDMVVEHNQAEGIRIRLELFPC